MYCSRCGKENGSSLGICDDCKSTRIERVIAERERNTNVESSSGETDAQTSPIIYLFLAVLSSLVIILMAVIFHRNDPDTGFGNQLILLLSLFSVFGVVITWGILMMRLCILSDWYVAIIGLIFPFAAYWTAVHEPTRHRKNLIFHFIFIGMAVFSRVIYQASTGYPAHVALQANLQGQSVKEYHREFLEKAQVQLEEFLRKSAPQKK